VICALVAAAALVTPSREELIDRWLHANRAHSVARLESPARNGGPPRDLRALAQRELAVPGRYQLTAPAPAARSEPWWARAWDWVTDRWRQLWKTLSSRVHVSERAANGIGDGLLVLIGLVLLFVAARILRGIQISRSAARVHAEPLAASLDPQALYRDACAAATRGEYGNAALLLFAATVALLDRRGAAAGGRSATVGDLRRELRGRDATLIPAFDAVSAAFVEKAYAERVVDAPQWRRAQTAFETLASPRAESPSPRAESRGGK
jgi:hypothetical protein